MIDQFLSRFVPTGAQPYQLGPYSGAALPNLPQLDRTWLPPLAEQWRAQQMAQPNAPDYLQDPMLAFAAYLQGGGGRPGLGGWQPRGQGQMGLAGFGGTGAGNMGDRLAPNVPSRPLSDLPGFMSRVLGGPLAWAGIGPMARADIRNSREQRGPGGGYGGSYGDRDRTSRGPGGTLGHI